MEHKVVFILFAATFLAACVSSPSRSDASHEEVMTRHGRIIARNEISDPVYDKNRQQEAESKSSRESVARVGFLFGAIGGALGAALAPASDTTEFPRQYKYLVRLDASEIQEVIDIYPFPVGDCVRVATGHNTGKLSLLMGYKGECDAIP